MEVKLSATVWQQPLAENHIVQRKVGPNTGKQKISNFSYILILFHLFHFVLVGRTIREVDRVEPPTVQNGGFTKARNSKCGAEACLRSEKFCFLFSKLMRPYATH